MTNTVTHRWSTLQSRRCSNAMLFDNCHNRKKSRRRRDDLQYAPTQNKFKFRWHARACYSLYIH